MLDVKGRKPLELSKIGDPFVNFIYSLALSKTNKRAVGKKVSNKILSEALIRSGYRGLAGSRMRKEDLGDFVEGLIFSAWAQELLTIDEAVEILSENLSQDARGSDLQEESIKGFGRILNRVVKVCQM